jgi:arsenate reductase
LSFIAEAIAKRLLPPKTHVFSAGLKDGKIDPKAVQVLEEIGISVSTQDAKRLDVIPTDDIDLVVMLGEPGESQPTVSPRARRKTWDISDPLPRAQGGSGRIPPRQRRNQQEGRRPFSRLLA